MRPLGVQFSATLKQGSLNAQGPKGISIGLSSWCVCATDISVLVTTVNARTLVCACVCARLCGIFPFPSLHVSPLHSPLLSLETLRRADLSSQGYSQLARRRVGCRLALWLLVGAGELK